jgi:hypothetical protein
MEGTEKWRTMELTGDRFPPPPVTDPTALPDFPFHVPTPPSPTITNLCFWAGMAVNARPPS